MFPPAKLNIARKKYIAYGSNFLKTSGTHLILHIIKESITICINNTQTIDFMDCITHKYNTDPDVLGPGFMSGIWIGDIHI